MRWTKAQFMTFSQQIKVRSVAAQDKPRAERDRLLQVKRELRHRSWNWSIPIKLTGLEKHR
jgi:hypothetical protein